MYVFSFLYMILFASSLKATPKFCVNCRYFIQPKDGIKNEYGSCSLFPIDDPKYLVDGIVRDKEYYKCFTARISERLCGEDAKKYKKKYKKRATRVELEYDESDEYDQDDQDNQDDDYEQYDEYNKDDEDYYEILDKDKEKYIWRPYDL